MGEGRLGATVGAVFVVASLAAFAAAGPLAAQQAQASQAQPSIMDNDEPDQAPPPAAKPARRSHKGTAAPAMQPDPDLDTNDQLAPSQIKQPMPAAVAVPSGSVTRSLASPASGSPKPAAHPIMHAATDTPPAPAAPPARATAPKPAPADAHVVVCAGIFSKDSSHLRLAMTYESKNIAFADVDASGGTKVPASVLYPNDPKRRLEVWWANPAARSQTYLIVINGQSTWTAPGGMKLGLTLAQLEKLNHKPFKVKGFDKSGVATVSDWDDGVLATLPGGCKSGLSLRADPKASAEAVGALSADQDFSSSDPAIRAVKPTVSEILIGY